ncbi:hypothetical protein BKA62DRAFT_712094 [Auriculariales sp. MPI-PUGE-AT-0066]|nr:hypothetical protein BKA62DRAFT_712094 [Auriculariales sp. MPI-PUGE-AT-0066]
MGIRWEDPEVTSQWRRALILVAHAAFGLYLYALLRSRRSLLQRRRRLTIGGVLYLLPRYTLSILGIVLLCMCNMFNENVNCTRWDYVLHVFAYSTNTLTQGLLYARVCALSKFNKYLTWGLGVAYAASWGMAINGMCKSEAIYFTFEFTCVMTMLFYLLRMHRGGNSSLWRFLLRQGITYLFWLCSAFLILVICVLVNPGDLLELICMIQAILVMTISGTRMQRNLVDFASQDIVVDTSSFVVPKPSVPPRRTDQDVMIISLAPSTPNIDGDAKGIPPLDGNEVGDIRNHGRRVV